jgi:hypothetical protein
MGHRDHPKTGHLKGQSELADRQDACQSLINYITSEILICCFVPRSVVNSQVAIGATF